MSSFDVSRADAHRTRGLVAAASLSLSAILLFALMTGHEPQSDAATLEREPVTEPIQVSNDTQTTEATTVAERHRATEPPAMSLAFPSDIIALNDAAFLDCTRCATTIQVEREVPRGGTLAGLLDDAGIDRVEAARAISALNTLYDLRYLRAGQDIRLYVETTPGLDSEAAELRLNGLSFRPDVEPVSYTHLTLPTKA